MASKRFCSSTRCFFAYQRANRASSAALFAIGFRLFNGLLQRFNQDPCCRRGNVHRGLGVLRYVGRVALTLSGRSHFARNAGVLNQNWNNADIAFKRRLYLNAHEGVIRDVEASLTSQRYQWW